MRLLSPAMQSVARAAMRKPEPEPILGEMKTPLKIAQRAEAISRGIQEACEQKQAASQQQTAHEGSNVPSPAWYGFKTFCRLMLTGGADFLAESPEEAIRHLKKGEYEFDDDGITRLGEWEEVEITAKKKITKAQGEAAETTKTFYVAREQGVYYVYSAEVAVRPRMGGLFRRLREEGQEVDEWKFVESTGRFLWDVYSTVVPLPESELNLFRQFPIAMVTYMGFFVTNIFEQAVRRPERYLSFEERLSGEEVVRVAVGLNEAEILDIFRRLRNFTYPVTASQTISDAYLASEEGGTKQAEIHPELLAILQCFTNFNMILLSRFREPLVHEVRENGRRYRVLAEKEKWEEPLFVDSRYSLAFNSQAIANFLAALAFLYHLKTLLATNDNEKYGELKEKVNSLIELVKEVLPKESYPGESEGEFETDFETEYQKYPEKLLRLSLILENAMLLVSRSLKQYLELGGSIVDFDSGDASEMFAAVGDKLADQDGIKVLCDAVENIEKGMARYIKAPLGDLMNLELADALILSPREPVTYIAGGGHLQSAGDVYSPFSLTNEEAVSRIKMLNDRGIIRGVGEGCPISIAGGRAMLADYAQVIERGMARRISFEELARRVVLSPAYRWGETVRPRTTYHNSFEGRNEQTLVTNLALAPSSTFSTSPSLTGQDKGVCVLTHPVVISGRFGQEANILDMHCGFVHEHTHLVSGSHVLDIPAVLTDEGVFADTSDRYSRELLDELAKFGVELRPVRLGKNVVYEVYKHFRGKHRRILERGQPVYATSALQLLRYLGRDYGITFELLQGTFDCRDVTLAMVNNDDFAGPAALVEIMNRPQAVYSEFEQRGERLCKAVCDKVREFNLEEARERVGAERAKRREQEERERIARGIAGGRKARLSEGETFTEKDFNALFGWAQKSGLEEKKEEKREPTAVEALVEDKGLMNVIDQERLNSVIAAFYHGYCYMAPYLESRKDINGQAIELSGRIPAYANEGLEMVLGGMRASLRDMERSIAGIILGTCLEACGHEKGMEFAMSVVEEAAKGNMDFCSLSSTAFTGELRRAAGGMEMDGNLASFVNSEQFEREAASLHELLDYASFAGTFNRIVEAFQSEEPSLLDCHDARHSLTTALRLADLLRSEFDGFANLPELRSPKLMFSKGKGASGNGKRGRGRSGGSGIIIDDMEDGEGGSETGIEMDEGEGSGEGGNVSVPKGERGDINPGITATVDDKREREGESEIKTEAPPVLAEGGHLVYYPFRTETLPGGRRVVMQDAKNASNIIINPHHLGDDVHVVGVPRVTTKRASNAAVINDRRGSPLGPLTKKSWDLTGRPVLYVPLKQEAKNELVMISMADLSGSMSGEWSRNALMGAEILRDGIEGSKRGSAEAHGFRGTSEGTVIEVLLPPMGKRRTEERHVKTAMADGSTPLGHAIGFMLWRLISNIDPEIGEGFMRDGEGRPILLLTDDIVKRLKEKVATSNKRYVVTVLSDFAPTYSEGYEDVKAISALIHHILGNHGRLLLYLTADELGVSKEGEIGIRLPNKLSPDGEPVGSGIIRVNASEVLDSMIKIEKTPDPELFMTQTVDALNEMAAKTKGEKVFELEKR